MRGLEFLNDRMNPALKQTHFYVSAAKSDFHHDVAGFFCWSDKFAAAATAAAFQCDPWPILHQQRQEDA